MNFAALKPHALLSAYIDTYWDVTCKEGGITADRVTPDGCVDIIINLGEDYPIDTEQVTLKSGKAYLGGTITRAMEARTLPDTHLAGVRFKPAAFSYFYSFSSLHETTNQFIELGEGFVPGTRASDKNVSAIFDQFFTGRLVQPKHFLLPVTEYIRNRKGNITVEEVARAHYTTIRQLERGFKYYVGISPKEYISITRYRFAHKLIKKLYPDQSLFDIAFECGYYDHAHLSNEIRKYTGMAPSELCRHLALFPNNS
jgi:AraC-like DNA-binding protein